LGGLSLIWINRRARRRRDDVGTMPHAPEDSQPAAPDTRERILEAAGRRFAAHGRDGVSMREISRDTGLTMPTVYHYFGDKQGLYEACVASAIDAAGRALQDAFHRGRTPAGRAYAFASTLCELLLVDPQLLAFLQREELEGAGRLDALVAAELLAELDTVLVHGSRTRHESMTPARRLLAYALGSAIVLRSRTAGSPGQTSPRKLARLLLQICRIDSGPAQ
jgi:AcrR family transcriptional regulator